MVGTRSSDQVRTSVKLVSPQVLAGEAINHLKVQIRQSQRGPCQASHAYVSVQTHQVLWAEVGVEVMARGT